METGDLRQAILLTLRRHGPLRLSDIAKKTSKSQSGISYQLQKMQNEGLIICTKEKRYRLADTKEMEKTILQVTRTKTLPVEEILGSDELRSFDQDKVRAVFDKMVITGLLEKVKEWAPRTDLLEVEKGYKLSFLGCGELGVCYFCNEPVVTDLAIEGIVSEETWTNIDYGLLLHPGCVANWVQSHWEDADYYLLVESCSFCGLPVNANNLMQMLGYRNGIEFSELRRYLSTEEQQAIVTRTKTEDGYENLGPIIYDEQIVEDHHDVEEIVSKIVERAEQAKIKLGEYDQPKRTDELWSIAAKLVEQHQSNWDALLKLCGPLLEPISVVYSQLPSSWANKLKRYEVFTSKNPETGKEEEQMAPTRFLEGAHAPVMIHDGKRYHLYCYKLAMEFGIIKPSVRQ
jgi:DNA-binding transcriptional ArsR family regulator